MARSEKAARAKKAKRVLLRQHTAIEVEARVTMLIELSELLFNYNRKEETRRKEEAFLLMKEQKYAKVRQEKVERLLRIQKIQKNDEEIAKGEHFVGTILILKFVLEFKQIAFIFEKDPEINDETYAIFANMKLPEGTPYQKLFAHPFASFAEVTSSITTNGSRFLSEGPIYGGSCWLHLDAIDVTYFKLEDMKHIVESHKRNYFGIVLMLQTALFSVLAKYFASFGIEIVNNTQNISPFSKRKTARDTYESKARYQFVDSTETTETGFAGSSCIGPSAYCKCDVCSDRYRTYDKFPLSFYQKCNSCEDTNLYQFTVNIGYNKESESYGIVCENTYLGCLVEDLYRFYDLLSIHNDLDISNVFGEQIYTDKTCQSCSLRAEINTNIQTLTSLCSSSGIGIDANYPIRYVFLSQYSFPVGKYLIPISNLKSIEIIIKPLRNYMSVPYLTDGDEPAFCDIKYSAGIPPALPQNLPFSIHKALWVALLSAGRFEIQLPSEIWRHIFGFIIVPSYALNYSHKLSFEGGVNSKNMIRQLSYIPKLLLCANDKSVSELNIQNYRVLCI